MHCVSVENNFFFVYNAVKSLIKKSTARHIKERTWLVKMFI